MSAGTVVEPVDWLDRAVREPDAALSGVRAWLEAPVPAERHVLARHVACLALVERGDLAAARRHATAGIRVAVRERMGLRAAQLRVSLAWIELDRGDLVACREQLGGAEPHLRGHDLVRLACVRGLAHLQADEYAEAVAALGDVLPELRRRGDRRWHANALVGRGLAWLYLDRTEAAETDLADAEALLRASGRSRRAAACHHNRGCVAMRAGDLPNALRFFDEALRQGLDTRARPEVLVDRAEALAAAGLTGQAKSEMQQAARMLAASGRTLRLAETRLALAVCALREGDTATAADASAHARRSFRSHRRPGWAALAAAVWWQAKLAGGARSRWMLLAARRAATVAETHGWTAAATELGLVAGRCALRAGWTTLARGLLTSAAASRSDETATVPQRTVAWLAEALLAECRGDPDRIFDACRQGLEIVDGHATAMASFELRIQAFGLAGDLADTAIRAAVRTGDAEVLLRWSERHRAGALSPRPLRPPADPALRQALVELRAAVAGDRGEGPDQRRQARLRVAALERRVRDRAMLVDGAAGSPRTELDLNAVVAELGNSVLLSFTLHNGRLIAVSVVDGQKRWHDVGSESEVATEVERLRRILASEARSSSTRVRAEFVEGAQRCAENIERRLLAPVLGELGKRSLIVVPTASLHLLAWARLPACRGRSVVVTPSLRGWLRAAEDARRDPAGPPVWVAGPGLDHATREVQALHAVGGGRLMVGADATADRVRAALDGASVAHVAAHGVFRDDQPLLSSIGVADGPLYAYDIDRLHRTPTTVVLSACEVGCSAVSRGDELSGLAAVLLARGTVTVIASIVPVPDERTAEVMMSLYRALRTGATPAEALASAQGEHGESGFLCLGHGGR